MEKIKVAVIGGSGLSRIEKGQGKILRPKTPFGYPSGPIAIQEAAWGRWAFLPRHGDGHVVLPSEVNQRANLFALKSLGVERVVSFTAVGSLKEELAPGAFLFPDQLVDETKGRPSTFFGEGVVAHAAFADPFCDPQSRILFEAARELKIAARRGGSYVCIEGPHFSTRAESERYRAWGCSVIGMTASPEAKLAREAEICYSQACMVTDYDCWKKGQEVSTSQVVERMKLNVRNARRLMEVVLPLIAARRRDCPCVRALEGAFMTDPEKADARTRRKLSLLIAGRL